MSPEAQRIAIAEACGWSHVRRTGPKPWDSLVGTSGQFAYAGAGFETVPDYLGNLNAMHEAEKTACRNGYAMAEAIHAQLVEICGSEIDAAFATAAHRAESFLRALNLWEDSK
jgi:hypothetical protein